MAGHRHERRQERRNAPGTAPRRSRHTAAPVQEDAGIQADTDAPAQIDFQHRGWQRTRAAVERARSTRTDFARYEVVYEASIAGSGSQRGSHSARGNREFHGTLVSDPEFAHDLSQAMGQDLLGEMTRGGDGRLRNPRNCEWHHPYERGDVVQLLRRKEHRERRLQGVLHPGGRGGFARFYGNKKPNKHRQRSGE